MARHRPQILDPGPGRQVHHRVRRGVHRDGVRIIKTPVRAPRANAIAERWVGSARRECLDQMLIADERHLWLVLGEYTDHYNGHRPHRSLQQDPPAGRLHPPVEMSNMRVLRRDRLGGFIREYTQVA